MEKTNDNYRYQNMLAEMEREGVTIADAAELLGMSATAFELKLEGRIAFTVDEVSTLRAALLGDATLDYLMEPNMDVDPEDGVLAPAERLALFTRYLCDVYGMDVEQLADGLGVKPGKLKKGVRSDGLGGWMVSTTFALVEASGISADFLIMDGEPERRMEAAHAAMSR